MGKKRTYAKSDGTKTVVQGGRIIGNLPSNRSTNPVSGEGIGTSEAPVNNSLTAGMSAEQINSVFEGFAARKEAERLAEERRPEVERMLAEEREERWQRFERERQSYIDEYDALPDNDKPVLDQQQIDSLTNGDSRIRRLVYNMSLEQQGKAIVGYLAKKQKRDISNPGFGGPTPASKTVTEEVGRNLARIAREKHMRDISDPAYGHFL